MSAILPPPSLPVAESPAEKLRQLIAEQGVEETATLARMRANLEVLQLTSLEAEEFGRILDSIRHAEETP